MKGTLNTIMATAMAVAIMGFSGSVAAKEKKLTAKDLPTTVSSAFKATYPDAKIKEVELETENGVEYYEIESVDGKAERELLYTKDGKVWEIEEEVEVEALPEAVKQAVAKAYPKGKIKEAEKATREASVQYELEVKSDGKKYEVCIDTHGTILKTEEKKGKKEKKDKKDKD